MKGKVLSENIFLIPGNIMENTILEVVSEEGHCVDNISIYQLVQHVVDNHGPCLDGMFLGGRGSAASRAARREVLGHTPSRLMLSGYSNGKNPKGNSFKVVSLFQTKHNKNI